MKKYIIMTLMISAVLISGCSKAPIETPMETPVETAIETPVETIVETPVESPVETPQEISNVARYENVPVGLSPLTGLPYEGTGKVIMLQMENTKAARPHSGLSLADLIYEMEVESRITRLTTFFLSEYPVKAGPVRSARRQHMYLWSEWNYLYGFYGGSTVRPGQNIYDLIDELGIKASYLDGMKVSKPYSRSKDRVAPHNAYANLQYAMENLYNFEPVNRSIYFDENVIVEGTPAKKVSLSYNDGNKITYTYDETSKLYKRFINGAPMMDKENNKQIEVTNIIVQHANHYPITGTVYTNIDLVGQGTAEYFVEGIQRIGTWERKDVASMTRYYDESGEEIAFKPGKSFIQIVRTDTAIIAE